METFKEKLKSVMDGIAEKGKSPFVLTFIIVWVLHHWELVYLMLNFGADYTAFQKLDFVQERLKGETYRDLLIEPFFYSVVSYTGYLVISLFFQWIYGMYKWGQAWVKLSIKDPKVIDISKYNELKISVSNKEVRLNDLSNQYNQLQTFKQEYQSYKTDLLKPIAYLMYKSHFNANTVKYYHPRTVYVVPKFLEAIWRLNINDSPSFFQSGSGRLDFTIKGNDLMNLDNSVLGTITEISYEKNNRFLYFKLDGSNSDANYSYFLFVINENELMGFRKSLELTPLSSTEKIEASINFVYFEKINP